MHSIKRQRMVNDWKRTRNGLRGFGVLVGLFFLVGSIYFLIKGDMNAGGSIFTVWTGLLGVWVIRDSIWGKSRKTSFSMFDYSNRKTNEQRRREA